LHEIDEERASHCASVEVRCQPLSSRAESDGTGQKIRRPLGKLGAEINEKFGAEIALATRLCKTVTY
jgi:hypothetical protein